MMLLNPRTSGTSISVAADSPTVDVAFPTWHPRAFLPELDDGGASPCCTEATPQAAS